MTTVAGELQNRVHNLEEEIQEMKTKMDLDIQAKDRAEIELETLKSDLDREGIPKCPICRKWFPNVETIRGHIDIIHGGNENNENDLSNTSSIDEVMENSDQSGYGTTKQYQLVAVQCKKCDETLQNNHLLRIHMRKHASKESQILKCTSCEYQTRDENTYLNHIVDNHSITHICQTCDSRFNTKNELINHVEKEHRFNTAMPVPQKGAENNINCFNCGTMLTSRDALMKHKKEHHWKENKCHYFHSVGNGCRFPDNVCFNVHWPQEQQRQIFGP